MAIARPNDGMPGDGAMYLHVGCALEHTKDAALLAALEKHSRGLTPQDVAALRTAQTNTRSSAASGALRTCP